MRSGSQVAHLAPSPASFSEKDHQAAFAGLRHGQQGVFGGDAANALKEEGGVG